MTAVDGRRGRAASDGPTGPTGRRLETVIVTGLSGAGRSTAAKCFEDLGFFVVDNLPPELIGTLVDLGSRSQGAVTRLAVVMDVRSRAFSSDLRGVIRDLADRRMRPRVLFLEASPTRCSCAASRTSAARTRCRATAGWSTASPPSASCSPACATRPTWCSTPATAPCTSCATRSSRRSPVAARRPPRLRATVVSFGFKYGLPVDADLVVDVRFLPNPHWIPELRDLTGRDAEVRDYVLGQEGADGVPRPATPSCCRSSAPATAARASAT